MIDLNMIKNINFLYLIEDNQKIVGFIIYLYINYIKNK